MDRNNQYVGRSLGEVTARDRDMAMNACAPVPAQSPLSNVIDALRRKVGALESLHDAMQQKLAPILVSVPEQPMKDGAGISGPQSAAVMELSELEYRLGILCRKLDTLITRIEA